ncbi:hypothetical protein ACFYPC_35610 [Streptomyces sp. NPDC005808]|uniref:hypothetical protein n=1 Tax=Streptomyces sp. NPDC005808 TaxID=3364734 RepID=UPI00367B02EC
MNPWSVIPLDDPLVADLRATFTVCRRSDKTNGRTTWTDADPVEAWETCDVPGWSGSIRLSADWDLIQITAEAGSFHARVWELSRAPVEVLILSAWIDEDGTVTELPETTRAAAWAEAFPGDWDRHAQRAAQWITCLPDPKDPFGYSQQTRFRDATDRAVSRLKKWAYRQLAATGVPMGWHIQDHRIMLRHGRYSTRVLLTGSDFGAVRAEWAGALPRLRDQMLADDRFRRAVNTRGTVIDIARIKAGPSLLDAVRRDLAADRVPHPRTAPFRTSSWVAWTCPDTGLERRGIVVGESLSRSKVVAVQILPDDGAEEIEATVTGAVGRLKACRKVRQGEPGTVLPASAHLG